MRWQRTALVAVVTVLPYAAFRYPERRDIVPVTILASHSLGTIRPDQAWGKAIDGHEYSQTATEYTPGNIQAMRSARLASTSYRLRTELAIEAWHWNPVGSWSDPAGRQGYWTSSAKLGAPILLSYGYRLPRRGRTLDDGDNDGYSRIDDGDTVSFWKSNPYLDPRYTHDSERDHRQWVVVDLGTAQAVTTAIIAWGNPFPRRFSIEYWTGDQSLPIDRNPDGRWSAFPRGNIIGARGGTETLSLGEAAPVTRFVRLTMQESSHTARGGNGDPRDSLGFALRELSIGTTDSHGAFHDAMHHATTAAGQSEVFVSSTDPWHRAGDLDSNVVQPGFDRLFASKINDGRAVMIPVGVLFDTPANAAAELLYLRARHYPVTQMELGEEPDGQRVTSEDFAALYHQFAAALRRVDAKVELGGPSLQTTYNDPLNLWPRRTAPGHRETWMGRFVDALETHHQLADFGFFSFEWYPFDDVCGSPAQHLAEAPTMLVEAIGRLRQAGLPKGILMVMTEFGYSAQVSPVEIDLAGALFNVETVANASAHGVSAMYAFGVEPTDLMQASGCAAWGNLAYFLTDDHGEVRDTMPAYYAARLLTTAWADSLGGPHRQFATAVAAEPSGRPSPIGAYALKRPDGRWSLLLVNRDSARTIDVVPSLRLNDLSATRPLFGPLEMWQYSRAEYYFHQDGASGRPTRDQPPRHESAPGGRTPISLPPMSITVVIGK